MKDDLYIYHHLGLGDHLICHGIVRYFCNEYNDVNVYLFVKPHNHDSVQFMYHDLKNLKLIQGYDQDADRYLSEHNIQNFLKIGFSNTFFGNNNFDKGFYAQVGVPFENRWDLFYVERDLNKEKTIYDYYNINSEYVFLHDDSRFVINDKYKKDVNYISPKIGLTTNIFDYLTLIENSQEIHCIESSFLFLIDSMIKGKKVFIHRYSRGYSDAEKPLLSDNNEYFIIKMNML
jgi:hypothetical protein